MGTYQKLTSWEWEALDSECNLADGHAHQTQNDEQMKIVNKLHTIYLESEKQSQSSIQSEFENTFFIKAGQKSYRHMLPPQYHFSCSLAIETVGNYLRLNNKSVSLIHPTFDNLADILKRHNIVLQSLEESALLDKKKLESITTDALMIVCPNNPSGQELSKLQFQQIVDVCKKRHILLIIDFSFRFYSNLTTWDQYEILQKSGVEFITLEDTGKTFPTLDLKLGILLASKSIYSQLQDITNDFLLNVSPFVFKLLTEYIEAENNTLVPSYQEIVNINRKKLIESLKDSPVVIQNHNSRLSVAWIKIPENWKSSVFCKWLETKKIFVLPGIPFFWNDKKCGENYFRVALARPTSFFENAAKKLADACNSYSTENIK